MQQLTTNLAKTTLATLTATALLATTACSTTNSMTAGTDSLANDQQITLNFQAIAPKVEGNKGIPAPVTCQDTFALGNPVSKTKIADLRFYVTNLQAIAKDGYKLPITLNDNDYQQADLGLIDLEDGTGSCSERGDKLYNHTLTGTLTGKLAKKYSNHDIIGVSFDIGVPSDRNHTLANDPKTKAPLDIQGMAWSWQMGRKFAKIELAPENKLTLKDGTKAKIHNLHLGKMGCQGDATAGEVVNCKFNNTASIRLAAATPLADNTIVLNLNKLYANSDITQDQGKKAGCMSFMKDPECQALFAPFGMDFMTGDATGKQTVFSLLPNTSEALKNK